MHKKNANLTSRTLLTRHYCFCDPNQVFMYLFSFLELHFEYDGNRRELKTKKMKTNLNYVYFLRMLSLSISTFTCQKMSNQPVKIKTTHRLLQICVWQGHFLVWHSFHWKCGLKILLIWAVDDSTIVEKLKIAQRHIGFSIALVFECYFNLCRSHFHSWNSNESMIQLSHCDCLLKQKWETSIRPCIQRSLYATV